MRPDIMKSPIALLRHLGNLGAQGVPGDPEGPASRVILIVPAILQSLLFGYAAPPST